MNAKETTAMLEQTYKKYRGNFAKVRKEMNKFIKMGRETGDIFLIGSAYYFLALANWQSGGDRDAMLVCSIKSLALLEDTPTSRMHAKIYNLLGIAYHGQENYQMALELYKKGYDVAARSRQCTFSDKLMAMNNIADCYFEMGDYVSSKKVFTKCLQEAKNKTPERHDNLSVFSINLASCCEKLGEYREALESLDFISEWVNELQLDLWACLYYIRRSSVSFAINDIENGRRFVENAVSVLKRGVHSFEVNVELEALGHTLLKFGELDYAKLIADILTDYSEKSGHTIDLLVACRIMADYYSKAGEDKLALEQYALLDELYRKRQSEIRAMQLTIHKKIKEAGREIEKLNRSVKANKEKASRDPLSGLLNRSALLTTSAEFIENAVKKNERIGAVFLDIDFFKQCNDTYGHAQGDEVIKTVAKICMSEENANVKFARYGGDEFFGIVHGLDSEKVIGIARSICSKVRELKIPNEKSPNGQIITLSAGVVNERITSRINTIIDIVNFADKALYHAKDSGRDAIFMLDYAHMDESGNRDVFVRVEN